MEKNVNTNFQTTFEDIDKTISFEEYRDKLISLLKPILETAFPNNYAKQQIRIFKDRINFSCPICSDSAKSAHKKRGNFILKGKHRGYFKCHNCGEFHKIDHFFTDFKTSVDLDVINYLSANLGNFSAGDSVKYDMSILLDVETIEKYAIDREELKKVFGLEEVSQNTFGIQSYLRQRLQFQNEKFLFNPKKKYLLILNLIPSGKIIGVQRRLFSGENRFLTFKLSKLYEEMKKSFQVTPEQQDYLDTLSMLFNICLVNFKKPIILMEGPMDAFLYKNAIANTGANKELNIDIPVKYFYDFDDTGRRKSIEKLNQGYEVFLWQKLIYDLNLPYKSKWDFNDLLIYIRKNNIAIPNFSDYFSKDPLDIVDI